MANVTTTTDTITVGTKTVEIMIMDPMQTLTDNDTTTSAKGWTPEMITGFMVLSNFIREASSFVQMGDVGSAHLVAPFGITRNWSLVVNAKRRGFNQDEHEVTMVVGLGLNYGDKVGHSARMVEHRGDRGEVDSQFSHYEKQIVQDPNATLLATWHVNPADKDGTDLHIVAWTATGVGLRNLWIAKVAADKEAITNG